MRRADSGTPATGSPSTLLERLRGWLTSLSMRRVRRAFRIGCLPVAVVSIALLALFILTMTYTSPPPWASMTPVDEYRWMVRGRLGLSLASLAVLQFLATWLLALATAAGAAAAVSARAALRPRLRVVRRRQRVAVLAVLLVRLALLGVLAVGAVHVYTTRLGPRLNLNGAVQLRLTLLRAPLLPALAGGLSLLLFLAGPLLQRRYGLALGALAGAFARERGQRAWAGVNARLSAGLATILGLLWSSAVGVLGYLAAFDPFYDAGRAVQAPPLFTAWPEHIARVLTVSLVIVVLVSAYLLGLIVLPRLFYTLANRRLRSRAAVPQVDKPL